MVYIIGALAMLLALAGLAAVTYLRRGVVLRRRLNLCHAEIERLAARATTAEAVIGVVRTRLAEIRRLDHMRRAAEDER